MHFDDDEQWTADSSGVNLLAVAAHEIGHSLGLKHSVVSGSIMNEYYTNLPKNPVKLAADDIAGAQDLYGEWEACWETKNYNLTRTVVVVVVVVVV